MKKRRLKFNSPTVNGKKINRTSKKKKKHSVLDFTLVLPIELTQLIFSCLGSLTELKRVALVCRRWKSLGWDDTKFVSQMFGVLHPSLLSSCEFKKLKTLKELSETPKEGLANSTV